MHRQLWQELKSETQARWDSTACQSVRREGARAASVLRDAAIWVQMPTRPRRLVKSEYCYMLGFLPGFL